MVTFLLSLKASVVTTSVVKYIRMTCGRIVSTKFCKCQSQHEEEDEYFIHFVNSFTGIMAERNKRENRVSIQLIPCTTFVHRFFQISPKRFSVLKQVRIEEAKSFVAQKHTGLRKCQNKTSSTMIDAMKQWVESKLVDNPTSTYKFFPLHLGSYEAFFREYEKDFKDKPVMKRAVFPKYSCPAAADFAQCDTCHKDRAILNSSYKPIHKMKQLKNY